MERINDKFSFLTKELISALNLDQLGVLILIDDNENFKNFVSCILRELPSENEKAKTIKALLLTFKTHKKTQQKIICDEISQHITAHSKAKAVKRKMIPDVKSDGSSVASRHVKPRSLEKNYEIDGEKSRELELNKIIAKKVNDMLVVLNLAQWMVFFDQLKKEPDNHEALWMKFSDEYSVAFACISTIFDEHWSASDIILKKIIKKISAANTREISARTGAAWDPFILTVLLDLEDAVVTERTYVKPVIFSDGLSAQQPVNKLDVLVAAFKNEFIS